MFLCVVVKVMEENSVVLLDILSNIVSQPATIVFLFILFAIWTFNLLRSVTNPDILPSGYSNIAAFILIIVFPASFILLTEAIGLRASQNPGTAYMTVEILRWVGLYALVCPLVLIITFRYSRLRSTIFALAHLLIFHMGWLINGWTGILLIATPIFLIFYYGIYSLSQIIYPAISPTASEERRAKFLALFWHIMGLQYPYWIASNSYGNIIEERISGNNFKFFGGPGIVWNHAHQVTGTTFGVEFSQILSPGISFTNRFERPISMVDLRMQLRTVSDLEAVTRDGVPITCVLFMAFQMDRDSWRELERESDEDDEYDDSRFSLLRRVPVLGLGIELDSNLGSSYPFSSARIRAALMATGALGSTASNTNVGNLYWDDVVIQRVTEIAQLAVSERTLNELWTPQNDIRDASALDEIATLITNRSRPRLRELGVKLFSARIVNYNISPDDPIRQQLIDSWLAIFNQRIESTTLDGQTEAEILRARARASAKDAFLQAITNSLQQAREIGENYPRRIIALNFISTLQQILEDQSPDTLERQREMLATWREALLRNR